MSDGERIPFSSKRAMRELNRNNAGERFRTDKHETDRTAEEDLNSVVNTELAQLVRATPVNRGFARFKESKT